MTGFNSTGSTRPASLCKATIKASSATTTTTKVGDSSSARWVRKPKVKACRSTSNTVRTACSAKPGTPPRWAAPPLPRSSSAMRWNRSPGRSKVSLAPITARSGSTAWIAGSTNWAAYRTPPAPGCPRSHGKPTVRGICSAYCWMAAAWSISSATDCTEKPSGSSARRSPREPTIDCHGCRRCTRSRTRTTRWWMTRLRSNARITTTRRINSFASRAQKGRTRTATTRRGD